MTMTSLSTDTYYMSLALSEANKGRYITRPNPAVGCVLVANGLGKSNGRIIGQGHTSPAGGNHGEINALANAKKLGNKDVIHGATAYVTLEPCSHYGRTPPCALALKKAGIRRVVIAGLDPNPQVAGQGVTILQEAGVDVFTFAEGSNVNNQAEIINKGFLKAMRTGMPYVRLKIATSLDGRTAMSSGESKWITGAKAREDVQHYRALSGAIITGSQTIIDDNPRLNVRSTRLGTPLDLITQPKPVILDRRHRLSKKSQYTIFERTDSLLWRNTEYDSLNILLKNLEQEHQCHDVLIESGASVAGAFIEAGLVDELIVYQAPCLLGINSRSMLNFSINTLAEQHRLQLISHEKLGEDLKLVFRC